jgi:KaiC/GvpD/RAD55 family RecA-like ATPase
MRSSSTPSGQKGMTAASSRAGSLRSAVGALQLRPRPQAQPVGILALDDHLQGGIPLGTTVLASGEEDEVVSDLLDQYAATGLAQGEVVYYWQMERPAEEVWRRLGELLPQPPSMSTLEYVDGFGSRFEGLPPEVLREFGLISPTPKPERDLVPRILKHPTDRPFRVVFDSVNLLIERVGAKAAVDVLRLLLGAVRARGGTAILAMERGLEEPAVEKRIRYMVDGILDFTMNTEGSRIERQMVLKKIRGSLAGPRVFTLRSDGPHLKMEGTRRI